MLPLRVAWGPDQPHRPPPVPPPPPDGLAGFHPVKMNAGYGMTPPKPVGNVAQQGSVAGREPLASFLSSFPGTRPQMPYGFQSGHMQAVARRANSAAGRNSLVHDYLATV